MGILRILQEGGGGGGGGGAETVLGEMESTICMEGIFLESSVERLWWWCKEI